ncbi:MraY family glycosyltransferase [Stratiformator vulcanicus]|uniref:WecA-like glycosyltransferase n=1 Tax=Stratiformator vulcanicus TaxID=2527980 RepID=A0A517QXR1_9PLAN|nr:MraY family glycosyltransferase [Stratiformator vulcanicus]QDT36378.1 WecA-like glycosyltransferase [Stratiformator vulcanicus]
MWQASLPELVSSTAVIAGALAVLGSVVATAAAIWVAKNIDLHDRPDGGRKAHACPIPVLGGVGVLTAFVSTSAIILWMTGWADSPYLTQQSISLFCSALLFAAIGLWDDIFPVRPWTKFVGQIVASVPFAVFGQPIDWFEFLGFHITLGGTGTVFTIFWLTACANAVNLIDGLDGLAGTLGLIATATIAVVAHRLGMETTSVLALMTAGSIVGFLCYNLPPAKIFLGDSGSLLIGYLIGALSIQSSMKTATGFALAMPLILISVPAFDVMMAILRRTLSGKGIGEGDRLHLHHRLQDRGLSRFQTLLVVSALSSMTAAITVATIVFKNDLLGMGLCAALLISLIVGRVFGHHETLLAFRKAQTVAGVIAEASGVISRRRLTLPRPNVTGWNVAVDLLREVGGDELTLSENDELGARTIRQWRQDEPVLNGIGQRWHVGIERRITPDETVTLSATGHFITEVAQDEASRAAVILQACVEAWTQELSADSGNEHDRPMILPIASPACADLPISKSA